VYAVLSSVTRLAFFSSDFGAPNRKISLVGNVNTEPPESCFRLREARRETLKSAARSSTNSLTRHVRNELLDMAVVAKGAGLLSMVMEIMMNDGLI
jgi:hypothetical protein